MSNIFEREFRPPAVDAGAKNRQDDGRVPFDKDNPTGTRLLQWL